MPLLTGPKVALLSRVYYSTEKCKCPLLGGLKYRWQINLSLKKLLNSLSGGTSPKPPLFPISDVLTLSCRRPIELLSILPLLCFASLSLYFPTFPTNILAHKQNKYKSEHYFVLCSKKGEKQKKFKVQSNGWMHPFSIHFIPLLLIPLRTITCLIIINHMTLLSNTSARIKDW